MIKVKHESIPYFFFETPAYQKLARRNEIRVHRKSVGLCGLYTSTGCMSHASRGQDPPPKEVNNETKSTVTKKKEKKKSTTRLRLFVAAGRNQKLFGAVRTRDVRTRDDVRTISSKYRHLQCDGPAVVFFVCRPSTSSSWCFGFYFLSQPRGRSLGTINNGLPRENNSVQWIVNLAVSFTSRKNWITSYCSQQYD